MNYIYETWLADLRAADASFVPNDLWYPMHRELIRRVLEGTMPDGSILKDKAQVVILADAVVPQNILGYLVRDREYLHWIHIRRGTVWRKRGLAKLLLQQTHSERLPAVWRTKLGLERLQNPSRSRWARSSWWTDAPSPS